MRHFPTPLAAVSLQNAKKVADYLDNLSHAVDSIPPVQQPGRFGNTAYRTWFAEMTAISEKMLPELLPGEAEQARREELAKYLHGSFGNATRIDYGTGHELAFAAFLCCLFKLKVFGEEDFGAVGFHLFDKCVWESVLLCVMQELNLT